MSEIVPDSTTKGGMTEIGPKAATRVVQPLRPNDSFRRVAMIGFGVIIFTFGVLTIWAAFTPLDSAVTAHGVVFVRSNRQAIQHFEGGIVSKILVHEGDKVKAGQTLFQLDPVQANAGRDIAGNQLYSLVAKSARLAAERDGRPSVQFPQEILDQRSNPTVAQAIEDEQRQFQQRRATIQSQVEVLDARIAQYKTEIEGIDEERASLKSQVGYLDDEISGLNELYKQNLVPKPRILALERDRANLEGQLGRLVADRSKAQQAGGETTLQIAQVRQQFYQDVSKDMADVETQLGDVRQRFIVAQDTARRIDIKSPVDGTAQNLRIGTEGAVIRPGDTLVEIAPDDPEMLIQAHFSPNDVDSVHPNMVAQLRFSTFHDRTIPVIEGTIHSVSQDRLIDEATHQPYFLAIVNLKDTKLPPQIRGRLTAGLPADVIVTTGKRSALQYIVQPLANAMRTTMREK
jgi:HlyD family type I secretion membrane fusion protein